MPTNTGIQPADDTSMRHDLLALIPNLRAFAISLTHDPVFADDLVQDTLVRAWTHRSRFEPGSNLTAWVFTILRNSYYSMRRRRQAEVEDIEGRFASRLVSPPEQNGHLDLQDLPEGTTEVATLAAGGAASGDRPGALL